MGNIFSDFIEDKLYNERYKVCSPCEKRAKGVCLECGCILQFKLRAHNAECPLQKWTKEQDPRSIPKSV